MKNEMIRYTMIATVAAVLIGLTGCGHNTVATDTAEVSKPAVAYMMANTACAKTVDSSAPIVQDTMIECAENYGYSFIVRVDGSPELVSAESLDIDEQYKNASKERLSRDARNRATNLLAVLDDVSAVYPEVDTWRDCVVREHLFEVLIAVILPVPSSAVEQVWALQGIPISLTIF